MGPRREYDEFVQACARSVKPGGRVVMQVINAHAYNNTAAVRLEPDHLSTFVQTHIFPGQQVPNLDWLNAAFAKAGFRRVYSESAGHDYAETLRHWAANLEREKH